MATRVPAFELTGVPTKAGALVAMWLVIVPNPCVGSYKSVRGQFQIREGSICFSTAVVCFFCLSFIVPALQVSCDSRDVLRGGGVGEC